MIFLSNRVGFSPHPPRPTYNHHHYEGIEGVGHLKYLIIGYKDVGRIFLLGKGNVRKEEGTSSRVFH